MVKTARQLGLCIVFIIALALPALAQQISYESAAVGRIVGETPGEMAQQLDRASFDLAQASYFGDNNLLSGSDTERATDTISALGLTFSEAVDAHYIESLTAGRWSWWSVKDSVSDWTKNALLALEAHGNLENGEIVAESPGFGDGSLTPESLDWEIKSNPVVIFNSDFSGAHLPKKETFVSKLNSKAAIIAPTAIPDKQFVKTFICNLGKYGTLGETYRESRNNYYWQTNRPSGIALMSFELYGNPAATVSVPAYDETAIGEFCKDFLKEYGNGEVSTATTSEAMFQAESVGQESTLDSSLLKYVGANNPFDRPEPTNVKWEVSGTSARISADEWGDETIWAFVNREVEIPATPEGLAYEFSIKGRDFPSKQGGLVIGMVADWEDGKAAGEAQCLDGGQVRSTSACTLTADSVGCSRGVISGSGMQLGRCTEAGCPNHPIGDELQTVSGIDDHAGEFTKIALKINTTHAKCVWGNGEKQTDWQRHGVAKMTRAMPLMSFSSGGDRSPDSFEIKDVLINGAAINLDGSGTLPEYVTTRKKSFTIEDFKVVEDGEFSAIAAVGAPASHDLGELMLPKAVVIDQFPPKTIVTGIILVEFTDPVDITIPNLPEWDGEMPVQRECLSEAKKPSVEYSHSFTGKSISITSLINPVEVVSCSEGKFKLYRKASYSINYISYSPVLIKEVKVPGESTPGTEEKATAVIENVRGGKVDGELVLSDSKGVVYEKAISIAESQAELAIELPFKTPSEEGVDEYALEFLQEGDVKTSYDFSVKASTISLSLETPEKIVGSAEVTATIENKLATPIDAVIQSNIIKNGGVSFSSTERELEPGKNKVTFMYEGLKREDTSYDVVVTANYGAGKESASTTLITNHPPKIEDVPDIVVNAGDTLTLNPKASDPDGDALVFSSSDLPKGAAFDEGKAFFSWTPDYGQAGDYSIRFSISDGLLEASETVSIKVVKVNRPPTAKITVTPSVDAVNEGDKLVFKAEASDPDGDALQYRWLRNEVIVSTESSYHFTPKAADGDQGGLNDFVLLVSDGVAEASASVSVKVLDTLQCEPGQKVLCQLQSGVCAGAQGVCSSQGKLPGCAVPDYVSYSSKYEPVEKSCDGLDNNCNGLVDEGFDDLDNDGVANCVDEDEDGDGIPNAQDKIAGDAAAIKSNIDKNDLKVDIDGKTDLKQDFDAVKPVKVMEKEKPVVEFDFDFGKKKLRLDELKIEKEEPSGKAGFVIISGLAIEGTKTVYVNQLAPSTRDVCVKDADIASVSEISFSCNGADEKLLQCDGAGNGGYMCALDSKRFKVTGLKHSGVLETCPDTDADTYTAPYCGGTDCAENDKSVNPAAKESCNKKDDNCDGNVDEGLDCNQPPVISSVTPSGPVSIDEGQSVDFSVSASDPDNDPLTYSWKLDSAEVSTAATYKYVTKYDSSGSHTVKIEVKDAKLAASAAVTIVVKDVLECLDGSEKLCPLQSGVCSVTKQSCASGKWQACSYGASYQAAETLCDNFDNDCDGSVDEGVKNACGKCGPVPAEICYDGLDNNCNGVVDDGCPPKPAVGGGGGLPAGGGQPGGGGGVVPIPTSCPGGTPLNSCSPAKQFYCNGAGVFTPACSQCGCPDGEVCGASGSCSRTYCVDNDGDGFFANAVACGRPASESDCNDDVVVLHDKCGCGDGFCKGGESSQSCPSDCKPPCSESDWNCNDWGSCLKEGVQKRICALKEANCIFSEASRPKEELSCNYPLKCECPRNCGEDDGCGRICPYIGGNALCGFDRCGTVLAPCQSAPPVSPQPSVTPGDPNAQNSQNANNRDPSRAVYTSPDGKMVQYQNDDGSVTTVYPDGGVEVTQPGGRVGDGEKVQSKDGGGKLAAPATEQPVTPSDGGSGNSGGSGGTTGGSTDTGSDSSSGGDGGSDGSDVGDGGLNGVDSNSAADGSIDGDNEDSPSVDDDDSTTSPDDGGITTEYPDGAMEVTQPGEAVGSGEVEDLDDSSYVYDDYYYAYTLGWWWLWE